MTFQLKSSIIEKPFTISIEKIDYYRPHWHDNAFEYVLVLKGSINATIGPDKFRMEEDDVLIISLEDVHTLSKTDEDNVVLILQFSYEYFEKQFPNINRWILICDPTERKSREESKFEYLRYYLSKITLDLTEDSDAEEIMEKIVPLLNYCEKVFQSTHMIKKKFDITDKQLDMFYEIEDYVYDNYRKAIDLNSISEYMNFNKYYFSHLVKKITGMNLLEYLNHIRVLAAERFLISTDLNVSDIAFKCGFSEIRSLTRYFKKWYECTPTQYRKIYCPPNKKNKNKEVVLVDTDDHLVKAKISEYISKIEKIKEINLEDTERGMCWQMPNIILPDIIEKCDIQKYQNLLEDVFEECRFKSIILPEKMSLEILLNKQTEWVDFLVPKVRIILRISGNHEDYELIVDALEDFVIESVLKYGEYTVGLWEINIEKETEILLWKIKEKLGDMINIRTHTSLKEDEEECLNFDDYTIVPYVLSNTLENKYNNVKIIDEAAEKLPVFNNNVGLLTYSGIKKPAYYAYLFLSQISNIIQKEEGFIVGQNKAGVQILLYNSCVVSEKLEKNQKETEIYKDLVFEILLSNICEDYKVKKYFLDKENGNAYTHWEKLGKPPKMNIDDEKLIKKISFPKVNFEEIINHKYIKLYEKIPPGGAELIVLEKK